MKITAHFVGGPLDGTIRDIDIRETGTRWDVPERPQVSGAMFDPAARDWARKEPCVVIHRYQRRGVSQIWEYIGS